MKFLLVVFLIFAALLATVSADRMDLQDDMLERKPHINNQLKCDVCHYVVKATEDLVSRNYTQRQIVNHLESACHRLPHKWAKQCEHIVSANAVTIIKKLVAHETPDKVCKQIHMCKSMFGEEPLLQDLFEVESDSDSDSDDSDYELFNLQAVEQLEKKHHKWHPKNPLKHLKCKACKMIASKAEKYVVAGRPAHEIEAAMDGECNHLGIHEAVKVCKSIVHSTMNHIIDEIKKHGDANHVCKAVHMC
ncbi:hypothetical protein DFA_00672 [Cavenderia fasciculata]|uniref:Saposin B-type domain-containing protein n=1 Tax=Cavenderia fasciculata TaxID=261658 RepID=F4PT71_CACFS|nr:uncharacterized protein DFA_00672 [Cavenderia fasciculata]EGG20807.1 hypothetical protein DFA_00672 [Cavenderia fasciculata]|eukprot:XP_004358657.1 hypothetical protein DFA_00672 [Cavenderia fasciculata]